MTRFVNARMYSVNAGAKAHWHALLSWVVRRAGLPWSVLDHDPPQPLSTLWARDDLGLAMMCGLPFSQRHKPAVLIAAPIPSPPRYGGQPVYFTDFVVASDKPYRSLDATFGGVLGYTFAESMSGGVAPYHHLMAMRRARGRKLFRGAVGDLLNARAVVQTVLEGRADVGPLDSYYHDLLHVYEPELASRVRTVATTAAQPIPPLIATADLSTDERDRLRSALMATALSPEVAPHMQQLLLKGFAIVDAADYAHMADMAQALSEPFEQL